MAPAADGKGYEPFMSATALMHADVHAGLVSQSALKSDVPQAATDEIDHAAQAALAAASQAARGRALYGEQTGQAQQQMQATARAAVDANPRFLDLFEMQRAAAHNMEAVVANTLDADRKTRSGAQARARAAAAPRHGLSADRQVADAGAGSAPQ